MGVYSLLKKILSLSSNSVPQNMDNQDLAKFNYFSTVMHFENLNLNLPFMNYSILKNN